MPKKILVIEDEQPIAEMIRFGLQRAGYQVILANNGQEGLALIKPSRPDLIISDILMPVMDGYTFYKEVRKISEFNNIPILILTARGKMEDSFKVIGVDDFIIKPFDVDNLLEKIATSLHKETSLKTKPKSILIAGPIASVVGSIAAQLKKKGCLLEMTTNGSESVSLAIKTHPEIILIDVGLMNPSAEEIIRALRCLPQFSLTDILLFNYLGAKDIGQDFTYLKLSTVNEARLSCLAAGGTEYLGNYSEPFFGDKIDKYLKKE